MCEKSVIRPGVTEEETSDEELPVDMDISLLKQQYNSIRDKQKLETRVVYFRRGERREFTARKTSVSLVFVVSVFVQLLTRVSQVSSSSPDILTLNLIFSDSVYTLDTTLYVMFDINMV